MSHIQCKLDGAVQCIAINRPEKKNALTAEMYKALSDAVEQAEADPAIRVMLLHAFGDAFTGGNDLCEVGGDAPERPCYRLPCRCRFHVRLYLHRHSDGAAY